MEEVKVVDSRALEVVAREPDPKLSENALRVLQKRYLKKDEKGKVLGVVLIFRDVSGPRRAERGSRSAAPRPCPDSPPA